MNIKISLVLKYVCSGGIVHHHSHLKNELRRKLKNLWRLNLMKKLLFPMILFLSLSLLIACGSDDASGDGEEGGSSLAQLQEAGKVTVGFANEKPYAYEEGGELKG